MVERYPESVVERFRAPRFALAPDEPPGEVVGAQGATAAGGRVEIHLRLNPDRTLSARFRAYGDPATIAAADWVCEQVAGCAVPARPPAVPDIVRALSLPGRSAHAAFLAQQALSEALAGC